MPRRSRGCPECKQRRIGCDGALPSCRQCIITNRTCSGAVQGSIFVDQTPRVITRFRKVSEPQRPPAQIPAANLVSVAIVSNFISTVACEPDTANEASWLRDFQRVPSDQRTPAFDVSLQAAACAYFGARSKDHALVVESYRLYGKAMSLQSKALQETALSPGTLFTATVLSLYESMSSTNLKAYAVHLRAAQSMLDRMNREIDEDKLVAKVARHVHSQSLFITVTSHDEAPTAKVAAWSPKSHTDCTKSQPLFDQLVTQLHRLWRLVRKPFDRTTDLPSFELNDVGRCIDEVWGQYELLSDGQIPSTVTGWTGPIPVIMTLMESYFAAAKVMFSLVGLSFAWGSSFGEEPCQIVLNRAAYLLDTGASVSCIGYDLYLPLTLVALHGSSQWERDEALAYIVDARANGMPFEGLRAIAVKAVQMKDERAGFYSR